MKTIKFRLNTESISSAISDLEAYKREFKAKCQLLMQKLVDTGADIAKIRVVQLGAVYSGNLMSSINGYYSPTLNVGFIRVNAEYGIFVEFGTGVKGSNSSHPDGEYLAETAYNYMGGTTYVTLPDGRVGWYYPADDGTWKFTEGQESRPFLWETAQELSAKFNDIVHEVFG
ncbi:MAG: hypothetical protein RSF40_02160 [Oscillospiraceae bacterium]